MRTVGWEKTMAGCKLRFRILNLLGMIYRYLQIKTGIPEMLSAFYIHGIVVYIIEHIKEVIFLNIQINYKLAGVSCNGL